jgi:hypothetical protein
MDILSVILVFKGRRYPVSRPAGYSLRSILWRCVRRRLLHIAVLHHQQQHRILPFQRRL